MVMKIAGLLPLVPFLYFIIGFKNERCLRVASCVRNLFALPRSKPWNELAEEVLSSFFTGTQDMVARREVELELVTLGVSSTFISKSTSLLTLEEGEERLRFDREDKAHFFASSTTFGDDVESRMFEVVEDFEEGDTLSLVHKGEDDIFQRLEEECERILKRSGFFFLSKNSLHKKHFAVSHIF